MAIGWDENAPADTDQASSADDAIRSLKTTLAIGLSQSLYWPGSGSGSAASAGQMKPGARAFYAAQSVVSANTDGFLMVTSDSSRLFGVNSTGTTFLGSARAIEAQKWYTNNDRWVMTTLAIGNGVNTSFGTVYNVAPVIACSVQTSATTTGAPIVSALTTGGVTVDVYRMSGVAYAASTWTVHVASYGTVTF